MRSNCPEFEAGRPARNRNGTIRTESRLLSTLYWVLVLAAWALAVASVPETFKEFLP